MRRRSTPEEEPWSSPVLRVKSAYATELQFDVSSPRRQQLNAWSYHLHQRSVLQRYRHVDGSSDKKRPIQQPTHRRSPSTQPGGSAVGHIWGNSQHLEDVKFRPYAAKTFRRKTYKIQKLQERILRHAPQQDRRRRGQNDAAARPTHRQRESGRQ